MSVAFDHRDTGTLEAEWQRRAPWRDASPLALDVERVVVVAAHPDDETLGAAGLIATAHERGIPVTVLVLTDGEGSHPGSPTIAAERRAECARALGALGDAPVRFAGLPDGGLRECRARVRDQIAAALAEASDARTLLAAPWWGDGHRDHHIAGETALRFGGADVRVVGYPIWMWHWAQPDGVDATDWRTLPLAPGAQRAKDTAVRAHASQLAAASGDAPILHAEMRAHFDRPFEVFIAPPASKARPVHTAAWFDAFYARHTDPWGFETRWYEERKRDVLLAALPRSRYRHVLELGCATGLLTERLAERADRVTAVDIAEEALRRARARVSAESVGFQRMNTPQEWPDATNSPDGEFDLVVLSELGYYWAPADLRRALARVSATLGADGQLVACHWRAPIEGCVLTGDDVHATIAADGRFRRVVRHVEEEFLVEAFAPEAGR